MRFVRPTIAVLSAAATVAVLSACSTGPITAANCAPVLPGGDLAAAVANPSPIGTAGPMSFPMPLVASEIEAEIILRGGGELVTSTDLAHTFITIADATNGDVLLSGADLSIAQTVEGFPAFGAAAACAPVGSRIAVTGTAEQLLGSQLLSRGTLPFATTDTVVMTVDVLGTYLARADGSPRPAPGNLPNVTLAPNGQPGITFTNVDPPTKLTSAVLQQGSGATVELNQIVALQYTAVAWNAREAALSTWLDGTAQLAIAAPNPSGATGALVPGVADSIIGQQVGSQLLIAVPPADGWAAGANPSVAADSTVVWVVDILGIVPTQ